MHAIVVEVLDRYLDVRRRFAGLDDHLFLSMEGGALAYSTARCAFLRTLKLANIAPGRARRPRIHDLRHSFATRVLMQCDTKRNEVARHFVALSTSSRPRRDIGELQGTKKCTFYHLSMLGLAATKLWPKTVNTRMLID